MTVLIADGQGLIGDYLRNHPDIEALGARVSVKMPSSFSRPWVLVTQIGAGDRSADTDHLVSHLLQFDCFSSPDGGSVEADLLGRTVRAALRNLSASDLDGWTPSVVVLTGPRNVGVDDNFEPARDRTMVDAEILLHPNGGGS